MAITKEVLSGSTRGRGVLVAATSSTGTTIHTTGTSATNTDEIWLYATNNHTAAVVLTIEYGTTGAANEIKISVPVKDSLTVILPGMILRGDGSAGEVVRAYAAVTNVVTIHGYVNRIAP
jgi:hypothetical protein